MCAQTSLVVVGSSDDALRVKRLNRSTEGVSQSMIDNMIMVSLKLGNSQKSPKITFSHNFFISSYIFLIFSYFLLFFHFFRCFVTIFAFSNFFATNFMNSTDLFVSNRMKFKSLQQAAY